MRLDSETIDRIKSTAQVVEVVGDYVTLRKKGANYWACCPFHGEKTPSFSISASKGIYKCFGCGKAGDSVRFIMDMEGLGYGEALRHLAKKYGIEIKEEVQSDEQMQKQNERESLFIVLEYAKNFFKSQLSGSEGQSIAYSYFKERGFSDATIQAFELGYSPAAWDAFYLAAKKDGFAEEILEKAGLVIFKREEQKAFDRFRQRVIFPIHNVSGKVIAFGGRILQSDAKGGNQAKYINSPETEVYHKSAVLYGLFQAKNSIRSQDRCFLVEGYTDVISLHQAGIQSVVASSGTSLTLEQIRLIGRFTKNITVLYDGDAAGIKAALRGMDLILEEGLQVNLVVFPDGEDPDSYVRKVGAAAFLDYIQSHSKDIISFQAQLFLQEAGQDPFKRSAMIQEMVESIAKIPDAIQRSLFIQQTAQMMHIGEDVLLAELNKRLLKKAKDKALPEAPEPHVVAQMVQSAEVEVLEAPNPFYAQELECIRLLINFGSLEISPNKAPGLLVVDYLLEELEGMAFETPVFQKTMEWVKHHHQQGQSLGLDRFLHHSEEEIQALAIEVSTGKYSLSEEWRTKHEIRVKLEEELLEDLAFKNVLRLRKVHNEAKMAALIAQMQAFDGPKDAMEALLERFVVLKEIQKNIAIELGTVIEK